MSDNDDQKQPLEATPRTPQTIAAELRLMAAGQGRYSRFAYMSPEVKNIWKAAADIIEDMRKS